ncbi:MAG: hypothetical protein Q7N50_10370 [Armatimonadota bacterium]|nr:hypothetical protein [Armatimonadota bacterium]
MTNPSYTNSIVPAAPHITGMCRALRELTLPVITSLCVDAVPAG